jgi:putative acetyltransferase
MVKIIIRDYCPGDLAALIDLFRGSVRSVARRDYSERQVLAWAPDFIGSEGFALRRAAKPTWVAEINGQIVGFADLESDGHVDMLFVHAGHQGKGIARALLAHIENMAMRQSLDRLYTEASITARTAFKRSGFQVITDQTVTVRGSLTIGWKSSSLYVCVRVVSSRYHTRRYPWASRCMDTKHERRGAGK